MSRRRGNNYQSNIVWRNIIKVFYKDKKIGQDGVLERTLYIPEYDTAGYLCQYKAEQYIGDKLRHGKVENWKFNLLENRIYTV